MIRDDEVYKIGRLGKPHGVKGEISMQVDDDVFDRVEADFLILKVDGILVPFYMEEYRFRSDTTALIKFEDVDTVEQARQLTNCDVFFLRRLADNNDEDLTWAFFVGFDLVEATTAHIVGRIAAVDDNIVRAREAVIIVSEANGYDNGYFILEAWHLSHNREWWRS